MRAVDFDVVIIGCGITGIYQLFRMREAGYSVRLLEAAGGVGGTWYWNRYPGARFDSESYTYGYFFSKELQQEWEWTEHFVGQAEIEAYLNYVVNKFDMLDHIQLNTRVRTMAFDDDSNLWILNNSGYRAIRARFVIAATGQLSVPYYPNISGRDTYRGAAYHTGEWPVVPVDFAGKRVAVIGTGSSGVQIVPQIADEVASLIVYQRTPNWCAPLNNDPISPAEQERIKSNYDSLYHACMSTSSGFLHPDATRGTFEDTKAERWRHYEALWRARGLAKLVSNYRDLMTDKAANDEFCEFLSAKIRSIVTNPDIATRLIPRDHGYGLKRPPFVTGYYEVFNRSNVSLVDLRETPIIKVTESGIETADGVREVDIIVWATGFDAITGALTKMEIVGPRGRTLKEYWSDGPRTYLGIQSSGFPNLLFAGGPHGILGNVPRTTEVVVDFIAGLLSYVREHGYKRIDTAESAEVAWTNHVYEGAAGRLLAAETSWIYGSNIPGKAKRFLLYGGGLQVYRKKLADVASNSYAGFVLSEKI